MFKTIQFIFLSIILFSSLAYSSTMPLEDFKKLKHGMTSDEVINIVGKPDYVTGSGLIIFIYKFSDGSSVWVGFTNQVVYVTHRSLDDKEIELVPIAK